MLKALIVIASLVASSAAAFAACPPGTAYNCVSTMNGKQSCGCR